MGSEGASGRGRPSRWNRGAGIPGWHVLPTAALRPHTPAAEPLTWPVGSGQCQSACGSRGLARGPGRAGSQGGAPRHCPCRRASAPPLCPGLPGTRGDAAPEAEAGPPERVLAGLREPAGAGQGGRVAPRHPEPLVAAGRAGRDRGARPPGVPPRPQPQPRPPAAPPAAPRGRAGPGASCAGASWPRSVLSSPPKARAVPGSGALGQACGPLELPTVTPALSTQRLRRLPSGRLLY